MAPTPAAKMSIGSNVQFAGPIVYPTKRDRAPPVSDALLMHISSQLALTTNQKAPLAASAQAPAPQQRPKRLANANACTRLGSD